MVLQLTAAQPMTVAIAGQGLDVVSTLRFLSNGSGCVEANPRYGPHPSAAALVGGKVALLGVVYVTQRLGNDHGRVLRWVTRGFGYAAGAVGAVSAARNLRLCGW
jgi:hypothetical protein